MAMNSKGVLMTRTLIAALARHSSGCNSDAI